MSANKEFERQYLAGELELEFTPRILLAEKLRAGGHEHPLSTKQVGAEVADESERTSRFFLMGETYLMGLARADVSRWSRPGGGARTVWRRSFASRRATSIPAVAMAGRLLCIVVKGRWKRAPWSQIEVHLPGIYVHASCAIQTEETHPKRTITEEAGQPWPGLKTKWRHAR
jgi:3-oxoacid CoA-transferase subunit A